MELKIKGMHCDACEKTITRALEKEGMRVENISYKEGKAQVTGTIPEARIQKVLSAKGYSLERERKRKHTYENEKKILLQGTLAFGITLLLQLILAFTLYKTMPGYSGKYFLPLLYVPIAVVAAIIALWHQRSYSKNVSCMTGMMIGMTIGMTTGFSIGAISGLVNGMFYGALIGTTVGIAAGVYAGKCCGTMGVMEGMMAGLMSGTMGAMLTVMMVVDHVEIFLPILIAIDTVITAGMMKIVIDEHADENAELKPWRFSYVLLASIALTVLISAAIMLTPKSIYG